MVLIIGFVGMIPANLFLLDMKDAGHEEEGTQASGAFSNLKYARVVPYLICTLDVVTAVGAGMTVKFFPLFFKQDYGLNPGAVLKPKGLRMKVKYEACYFTRNI